MESVFSKVTGEISTFHDSAENCITLSGMFRKFQKISWRSSVSSFFLNYRPKNYSPQRRIFLNPEKFLLWSFLWQKQALTSFLQKSCSKQLFGNLDFCFYYLYRSMSWPVLFAVLFNGDLFIISFLSVLETRGLWFPLSNFIFLWTYLLKSSTVLASNVSWHWDFSVTFS